MESRYDWKSTFHANLKKAINMLAPKKQKVINIKLAANTETNYATHLQWADSKVRKNTLVLLLLTIVSTQDAQVSNALPKAVVSGIPSFSELPTWKYQPLSGNMLEAFYIWYAFMKRTNLITKDWAESFIWQIHEKFDVDLIICL